MEKLPFFYRIALTLLFVNCGAGNAMAQLLPQNLPGAADAARIKTAPDITLPERDSGSTSEAPRMETPDAPAGAEQIRLVLKNVQIEGVTAFTADELRPLYQSYINQDITLDKIWVIAARITALYRERGYFLSRAFVPEQGVENGTVIIRVIEGYVGQVELNDKIAENSVVRRMINQLMRQKPLKTETLESFLLQLNDQPGLQFRSIIAAQDPATGNPLGNAVKLILERGYEGGHGTVSYDNYGSRFLGPSEISASYGMSLLPLQQTTVSVLATRHTEELKYGSISHEATIFPRLSLIGNAGYTHAEPGFSLEPLEIVSESINLTGGVKYQAIRQRDQNLALQMKLDGRNTNSDILSTALTRDRVRALRVTAAYDNSDDWQGRNIIVGTFSQGLNILSASQKGDLNLSRAEATPDFSKAELSISRLQGVTDRVAVYGAIAGQIASGPLYSSEEFGYGGQDYGRAYDSSELTGDHGVNAAIELRYAFDPFYNIYAQPYIFYDIGQVWNDDTGQDDPISGSSAGIGLRIDSASGLSGNIAAAFPLTRPEGAPLNGNDKTGRIRFGLTYNF